MEIFQLVRKVISSNLETVIVLTAAVSSYVISYEIVYVSSKVVIPSYRAVCLASLRIVAFAVYVVDTPSKVFTITRKISIY